MTKHILDHTKTSQQSWLRRAATIERNARPSSVSLYLQRRKRDDQPLHRAKYYLRFARGMRL